MTTVYLILVCLLAAGFFVLLGALVEMYGQLQQVRAHLAMFDSPTPLELGEFKGVAPSTVGLAPELDTAEHAMVLFLSDKCQTCYILAAALEGGSLPPLTWLVVVPVTGGTADDFIEQFSLRGPRTTVDHDARISSSLGLDITPCAAVIRDGCLDFAQTVPSRRQLYAMLPSPKLHLLRSHQVDASAVAAAGARSPMPE